MIRSSSAALLLAITSQAAAAWPSPRLLDPDRLERAGLRQIESERCELVTDLPSDAEVDALPHIIDLATSQWAERFGVGPESWRVRLYLIRDRDRFAALGLMPRTRDFPDGLALGYEAWVIEQPSPYYRRALVLHEATHSYMMTRLGGCGPGWHMEGIAELCGAHSWDAAEGALSIGLLPASREASPYWGRVKLVRQSSLPPIEAVLKLDNRAALPTTAYASAWALTYFLDNHPAYRDRFRSLTGYVGEKDFNDRFWKLYSGDRSRLEREWRLFAATLQYGHDLRHEAIKFDEGALLQSEQTIELAADRGWQATGIRVESGERYRIKPSGRFVIAREPDGAEWPCEAGGVTIRYYAGRPLGELLAVVDDGVDAFTQPVPIGLSPILQPQSSGALYLRVNDSPAKMRDNEGTLRVKLSPLGDAGGAAGG